MQTTKLLFLTALMAGTAQLNAQGLLQSIITPDKAVATVHQTLEGTWMAELRPPGLPAAAPAIPNISTFGTDTVPNCVGIGRDARAQLTESGFLCAIGDSWKRSSSLPSTRTAL